MNSAKFRKALSEAISKSTLDMEWDHAIRSITRVVDPNPRAGLTVQLSRRHKPTKRDTRCEYVLTYGRPNYAALQFMRAQRTKPANNRKSVIVKYYPVRVGAA